MDGALWGIWIQLTVADTLGEEFTAAVFSVVRRKCITVMYQWFMILIHGKCISDTDTDTVPKCIMILDTWYFFVSRYLSWYMYHWYSPTLPISTLQCDLLQNWRQEYAGNSSRVNVKIRIHAILKWMIKITSCKSYDTKEEYNVDSKAEWSALSSTRSQKKMWRRRN